MAAWQVRRRAATFGALLALAPGLVAPSLAAETVGGSWEGSYLCAQGATALTLSLQENGTDGGVTGLFHFHASADNPDLPEGCFAMTGTLDRQQRVLTLSAGRWLLRPAGYVSVDLTGWLNPDGDRMGGRVAGPLCSTFELRRVSAKAVTPSACLGSAPTAALR